MGMTNAEKQAAWRERQAANKRRVADLEEEVARLNAKLAGSRKAGALWASLAKLPPKKAAGVVFTELSAVDKNFAYHFADAIHDRAWRE
jgi:hypothetical protein